MADFTVRIAHETDVSAIAAVLTAGYGREFTEDWVRWKHLESPWGRSQCHLAADDEGVLGIVFRMAWPSAVMGQDVDLFRMVDGASTPRAVRRGVFRSVVRSTLDDGGPFDVALATATPEARGAHIKNGAITPDSIRTYVVPALPRRAALNDGHDLLDAWTADTDGLHTRWDGASLKWRLSPRSGLDYRVAALRDAENNHGIVYRTVGGRFRRAIAVVSGWGPNDLQRRAIQAACWRARTPLTIRYAGSGTAKPVPRPARKSGESLMCVWGQQVDALGVRDVRRWSYDGLELEGVV